MLKLVMGIVMLFSIWLAMKSFFGNDMISISAGADVHDERVIVIDPGHGGVDPGVLGVNDTVEKDINLKISMILKEKLEEKGYTIILTRQDDKGLYSEGDKNKKMADMRKRCGIIKDSNAILCVSIHQNSFSDQKVSGAQVFDYKHSSGGKRLAGLMQASIKENVDPENSRVIKENNTYYMLLHTPCPTVIVECGFITNYEEATLLTTEDYQEKIADAIARAVDEYVAE